MPGEHVVGTSSDGRVQHVLRHSNCQQSKQATALTRVWFARSSQISMQRVEQPAEELERITLFCDFEPLVAR